MGRPGKITVDYFPHVTNTGKTIAILESRWGNDGYSFWFKLLELIGNTSGFCYNCNNPSDWEYLLSKTRVTEEVAAAILDKLSELEAIDAELWLEKRVWSENFVIGVAPAFEKRVSALPQKPELSIGNPAFPGPETGRREERYREKKNRDKINQDKAGRPKKKSPDHPCPSSLRKGATQQADTVYLKPEELERLQSEHGEAGTRRLVELLDAYKTNHPDKCAAYRDDYKVILAWVISRYRQECAALENNSRSGQAAANPHAGRANTFIDKLAELAKKESMI
jgi:hypothetical protein